METFKVENRRTSQRVSIFISNKNAVSSTVISNESSTLYEPTSKKEIMFNILEKDSRLQPISSKNIDDTFVNSHNISLPLPHHLQSKSRSSPENDGRNVSAYSKDLCTQRTNSTVSVYSSFDRRSIQEYTMQAMNNDNQQEDDTSQTQTNINKNDIYNIDWLEQSPERRH